MSKKVLLIGSGLTAEAVKGWDLTGWIVCAIHHAWKLLPDRWDILLHANDFPGEHKPQNKRPEQLLINTLDWVDSVSADLHLDGRHSGFWLNHTGCGKTMFFYSFWWIYENINPDVIGVIGCDMHYPEGDKNSIHGIATKDPLKYHLNVVNQWLGFIDGFCCRDDVLLINYSPYGSPTLLPFSHGIFPEEKPIDRPREHRTDYEFYPNIRNPKP
jgi:hypothetical protein